MIKPFLKLNTLLILDVFYTIGTPFSVVIVQIFLIEEDVQIVKLAV